MHELLTAGEVAEKLSISINTVRKWTSNGRLPYVKLGAAVRFRATDIEEIIQAGLHPTTHCDVCSTKEHTA